MKEMEDIRDIREVITPGFWESYWYWSIGLVLLSLFGFWVIKRFFRHTKKSTPPLTPYERAMKQLAFVRGLFSEEAEVFSSSLSLVLRTYLEEELMFPVLEWTTEEFLEETMKNSVVESHARLILGEFLQFCDLAKFARHPLEQEKREKLYKTAKGFIEEMHQKRHEP